MDVEMKPDYVSFLDILPPVEFGCIYGSSLHPNNSDKTSMVDFILGVADTQQWHAENLKLNRNHYASWMVHLGEAQLITWVADHIGVRVHFNPFVSYRDRMFKYGVVSMKDLIQDILGWESFYLSGRLQKPVNVIVDKLEIEKVNSVNLKAAASTALLLLPSKFSEEELYAKICSLSYMGDLRMLFAEDKNKVKKIVQGQFNLFQKMYAPFLEEFAAHDLLRISSSADQKVNLIQDCGLATTCSLVSSLPLPLRYHMGMKLGEEKAIEESGRAIQNLAIKSKEQAADCMRKILRRKVMVSSARQAVAGLLTSGAVHGVKYVGNKMKKFLIEYGPGINHPIPSTRYLSPIDRWRLTENKEIGEVIYSKSFFLVKQSVEFWVGGMGLEGETNDGDSHPRSYWRFSKQDFFPEKSFENWSFYLSALSQTRARFKDRLLNRSEEATELIDLRKQSENTMKRCLNWWDLTWFGFGAVIGTGIFVLTGQEAHKHAGPAIILSYVASGISAMLSVFCYTEFAVEIPVAGGSFAYLRVELGDLAAFITAGNILLESIVGSAAVARGWTSYFTTLLDRHPDSLRIHTDLHHDFNLLDPIAAGVLLVAAMIAITSAKKTSYLNWIASAVNTVVILFVIVAGFAHAETSNLQPFLPFGAKGVLQAAAVVYFAYGGFDNIATMAEETKDPSRDIPLGLLGSMSLITVIYCLMALSLTMMQNYTNLDTNAAYSVAFQSVGMKWAKYLVALGALKGMTTVLLVGALGQARYTTHIARSHMIPPWFALVHPKTGTPIYATLLITMPSAIVAFFSSLDVLSSLLSVSTLFIFMMMAVALLVRRYYMRGVTPKANLMKLVGFLLLIVASSIGTSAFWGMKPDGWIGYAITLPVWFLATLGIAVMLPQERRAKVWGVPMVPWLPSLSIGINLFLMGSLSGKTFMRFGICTVIMLLYYVFLGVHATYDMAHQRHMESPKIDDEQLKSSA